MPPAEPVTARARPPSKPLQDPLLVAVWSRFWSGFHVVVSLGMLGWVALMMWLMPVLALAFALGWIPALVLLWHGVRRWRDRAPVLVMNAHGLKDRRPPLNGRLVPWRDMRKVERGSNNRLLVSLHPDALMRAELRATAKLDRALRSLTLDFGDVAIDIGGLSHRPGALVARAQRAVARAAVVPTVAGGTGAAYHRRHDS